MPKPRLTPAETSVESAIATGEDAGAEGTTSVPESRLRGTDVEDEVAVPVTGDPTTEPDASTTNVTGTTNTAVSVADPVLDEPKLGSDTTTGDSCLDVSTLDVS